MSSIHVDRLTKIYGSKSSAKRSVRALDDLSLEVQRGSIFGLLGQNGAGKTTLVKILLGITLPTNGSFGFFDWNASDYRIKQKIGYLPESHKFPHFLSGKEVLYYLGRLSGMDDKHTLRKKIDELLKLVNLEKWGHKRVRTYSKGMTQRLGLAQAMLHDPEVLFLDEPTDGVDPVGRKEIRDILLELKSRSKTIFINSHLLSEVELITDRVAILDSGKLLREGNVKEMTRREHEYRLVIEGEITNTLDAIQLEQYKPQAAPEGGWIVSVANQTALDVLIDTIRKKGISIKEIAPTKSSLEDIFISLVRDARKEEANA